MSMPEFSPWEDLESSLQTARKSLENGLWEEVLYSCHQYLISLPLSANAEDVSPESLSLFRNFAGSMIDQNHSYDSVVDLLRVKDALADYVANYFRAQDKKGIQMPTPIPAAEDAHLVLHFCLALHALVVSRTREE